MNFHRSTPWLGVPTKDREIPIPLGSGARILYLRSSARPVEYAVLLQKGGREGWKTVIVADNSHAGKRSGADADEHHWHRYVGDEKQPAEPLPFQVADTNDAMAKVMQWFKVEWRELTS